MKRLNFGLSVGVAFAVFELIPIMMFMDHPHNGIAMAGAVVDRFAIGFLIPNVSLPFGDPANGVIIGLLLSLPSAIISGAYDPIVGVGVVGGLIIGFLTKRFCASN